MNPSCFPLTVQAILRQPLQISFLFLLILLLWSLGDDHTLWAMSTVSKANTRSLEAVEVFLITEILTLLWVFLVLRNAIAFLSDTEYRNTIFSEQSQREISPKNTWRKMLLSFIVSESYRGGQQKWLRILLTFRALALRQSDDEGLTLERQACNSLWWQISVINSVDNTKLPWYTLPRTQHHSFFRKLPL